MDSEIIIKSIKMTQLPTVVVEGKYDAVLLRWIEEKSKYRGSVLLANSRKELFKVYNMRETFRDKKVIFIADKDTFIITGIPVELCDIIFTIGYSIENDLLQAKYHFKLFDRSEKIQYEHDIKKLTCWFCSEMQNMLGGFEYDVERHPMDIMRTWEKDFVCSEVCRSEISKICEEPELYIRGKNLIDLIAIPLNSPGRFSKFSKKNIFELLVKNSDENKCISRLIMGMSLKLEAESHL